MQQFANSILLDGFDCATFELTLSIHIHFIRTFSF